MVLYGTRPEAIKLAPVVRALQDESELDGVVTVTGQHREMLDQVNNLFGIKPEHDLDIMVPGASLDEIAARALTSVSAVLRSEKPDVVVIQGDTSTAFVAGLAAFYQQIPVVHVEAGLRTGDLMSPFPEEANRQLAARITALHLAPTATAKSNLISENVDEPSIVVTGNTVIDALHEALTVPVQFGDRRVEEIVGSGERYVLVTAHRRESWGEPMRQAMTAVRETALTHPDLQWVLPMHRNPVVREVLVEMLSDTPNVLLTEPLTYHEFCHAMERSHLLLTDSGGVQEEAPSLGKPVLVMRDTTERPEAITAGTVELVGTATHRVGSALTRLLDDESEYSIMANAVNPYGDGRAAERSIAALRAMLGFGERLPDYTPEAIENGVKP